MLNVIILSVIMLNVIRLNVIILSVIILSVIILSVIILSVIILSVIILNVIILNVIILSVIILNYTINLKCINFYSRMIPNLQVTKKKIFNWPEFLKINRNLFWKFWIRIHGNKNMCSKTYCLVLLFSCFNELKWASIVAILVENNLMVVFNQVLFKSDRMVRSYSHTSEEL